MIDCVHTNREIKKDNSEDVVNVSFVARLQRQLSSVNKLSGFGFCLLRVDYVILFLSFLQHKLSSLSRTLAIVN